MNMRKMDLKEQKIFHHYKYLIEKRMFNEYDIYGFLILIRPYILKGDCPLFYEFTDMVAHRKKDQGIIYENIVNVINNKYEIVEENKLKDYKGYPTEKWNSELKRLLDYFCIKYDKLIIKELTICIYSIFQEVIFVDKKSKEKIGKLTLFFNTEHKMITLCTKENKLYKFLACFTKLDNIIIEQSFGDMLDDHVIETYREKGILKVKNSKGFVCEIK